MKFIKSNPHPKGKKIGDCVIRALSYAENKKWNEIYEDLTNIGKEIYDLPNSKPVYEKYLLDKGWVKNKMPKHPNGRRMKLSEFIGQHPDLCFIANVVKHIAYIEKGSLLDTWDCSRKCIGNYFTK